MVTLTQVYVAAEDCGFHCHVGADRLVFPCRDYVLIAYLEEGGPEALVFDSDLRIDVGMEQMHRLATVLNQWNLERIGPVLSLRVGDNGEVSLHTRMSILTGVGLTPGQLTEFVRTSVEATRMAVDYLATEFPDLAPEDSEDTQSHRRKQDTEALSDPLPRDRHVVINELDDDIGSLREISRGTFGKEHSAIMSTDQQAAEDWEGSQDPTPVTAQRINRVLSELGIKKTQGDDDLITAWINDVLFCFFLDNGPSYLIKGHWDSELAPGADFLRMFLLCNDWNQSSLSTKAFCHEDEDGLQIRAEFIASIGEGLNDAQLEHNTAVAINQVLHAIDSISTEATGESTVDWP
ncbi:YbjN domain-containing protein [Corynebacterium alimapuense]|uniref:YbjN domain-containing protein n=1 Tax=Corynebacterium alimapuense TaxID=1576874 RepID=A0A3M8K8J4_9CORY|nr:YbjN domain-containing protein [Corynebacterium alimapuense]RNE49456.1 hypothetical protein C5L39_03610 [Corynebacterium alimapuense]